MNKSLIRTLALVLCLTLLGAPPAWAKKDNPLKISNMEISVMPEYDTQDVLVLYTVNYVNTSNQVYNGEIRFPVSKGSTNNIVIETATVNDNHLQVKVEDKGDFAEFVWQPTQPIQPNASYPIHLEYYYNPLPGTGNKAFTYGLRTIMLVEQAKINVLQPQRASNFKMEPSGQLLGQNNQGFQVYGLNYFGLKPGEKKEFKVSYTKDDPNPSVQASAATQAGGQSGPEGESQLTSIAVVVPLIALVAIIGIIAVKAADNREQISPVAKRREQKQRGREAPDNKNLLKDKKKLRQMLLNGEISEDTYHELLAEIEEEYS